MTGYWMLFGELNLDGDTSKKIFNLKIVFNILFNMFTNRSYNIFFIKVCGHIDSIQGNVIVYRRGLQTIIQYNIAKTV